MKLNTTVFIDLEKALVNTKSNKRYPIDYKDWIFNDDVLNYIQEFKPDFVNIIVNRKPNDIFIRSEFDRYINTVQNQLLEIIKTPVYLSFYDNGDVYFKYPNPGAIYNFAIENDLDLNKCSYIGSNEEALVNVSIGIKHFILDL